MKNWIIAIVLLVILASSISVTILLVLGNNKPEGIPYISIGEITTSPENYINKKVQISGILTKYIHLGQPVIDWDYYLKDEQGYSFPIELLSEKYRDFIIDAGYVAVGSIDMIEYCYCETKFKDIVGDLIKNSVGKSFNLKCNNRFQVYDYYKSTNEEWQRTSYKETKELASSCNMDKEYYNCTYNYGGFRPQDMDSYFSKEYRCNPESIERFYYFKAIFINHLIK